MDPKPLTDKSKLTTYELLFLIVSAVCTLTIVSACSPLYPFNPWDDTNCFFTLGRGIIHGLVPYRDLYEQKGPLLYLIYAFAALINERSFIGAWIVECAAASVFAVYSWKIAKLFTKPQSSAFFIMPLFLGLTYTTKLFNFGGNAEELCFPLLTVALYIGLRAIVNADGLPSNMDAFLCGLITAALFWIKYTFIGYIAGYCLFIIVLSIKQKDPAKLWSLIWRFLLGFITLTLPILIYFLANNALGSLWEVYFYNNLFHYHNIQATSGPTSIPVIKNIYIPMYCLIAISYDNKLFGVMLLLSLISLFFIPKQFRKRAEILFAVTFCLSIGIVFTKNTFIYYYLYLSAYCFSLILIPVIIGLNRLTKALKNNSGFFNGIIAGFMIICYLLTLLLNKNMYLFMKQKVFLVQYRYAEIINRTPEAKVLTYDVMDSGFYTAAGLLPANRYYCYLNIEKTYPPILEEQHRLIDEGYFDYVITTTFCDLKLNKYELIAEERHDYVDYSGIKQVECFRLYKKV